MHRRVALWDSDVVNEGEWFRANADKIVDVHSYTVDTHTLQPPRLTGQLQFRAHSIGCQGESRITEFDDASEPTRQGDWSTLLTRRPH